jgi:hypothetical protein
MTERVDPVLLPGQKLADGTGQACTGCGRAFGDGEKAIATPPSYPDMRRPVTWTCASCYTPPARPERFTGAGYDRPDQGRSSLTSWSFSAG